jgi:hypothetical protein
MSEDDKGRFSESEPKNCVLELRLQICYLKVLALRVGQA